ALLPPTLSLPDALPISRSTGVALCVVAAAATWLLATPLVADALVRSAERYPALDLTKPTRAQAIVILAGGVRVGAPEYGSSAPRSEEHTSELQSPCNLV